MKNGGQIPWNANAICETFKISCLMGRHSMKDQSFHLVHWLSTTFSLRQISQKVHQFGKKSYLDCSSDRIRSVRERNLEG